jgi:hypothetical protein
MQGGNKISSPSPNPRVLFPPSLQGQILRCWTSKDAISIEIPSSHLQIKLTFLVVENETHTWALRSRADSISRSKQSKNGNHISGLWWHCKAGTKSPQQAVSARTTRRNMTTTCHLLSKRRQFLQKQSQL